MFLAQVYLNNAKTKALSDRNMKDALQHNEMLAIKAFPHLR
jgi:hypothetical protein